MKAYFQRMKVKGKCPPRVPFKHILWSGLGSFLGIFLIGLMGYYQFSGIHNVFLIGSFGASAVLVYGAPLAPLSQPRNLIGGHVVSALVGVTVYLFLGSSPVLASAIAVSVSIMVMHLTRTLHPPGGATALIAVIGGEKVHALGYVYVVAPVLIGAFILLMIALKINNLSTNVNRHYPVYWY